MEPGVLDQSEQEQIDAIIATRATTVQKAVYHEVTDSWIAPQADPYTLENFQKAYDKLAATTRGFDPAKKLEATHYALKIYPKTEAEQWEIEMMKDVHVAYIPFDYVQLTQQEVEQIAHTRSAATTFAERSPYTVTHDDVESTDGGPTGPQTFQLPILYAVWPVDKPLPASIEYVIDYEVFLPRAAARAKSTEAMTILETEAIMSALGYLAMVPRATPSAVTRMSGDPVPYAAEGRLVTYDSSLNRNVPLSNLDITYQLGTNIVSDITRSDGTFIVVVYSSLVTNQGDLVTLPLTVTYKYDRYRSAAQWTITTESSTNPYTRTILPTLVITDGYDWYGNPDGIPITEVPSDDRQANEIHRAVNYYYNVQTEFPRHCPPGGLRIMTSSNSGGNVAGYCSFSIFRDANGSIIVDKTISSTFVFIYNNGRSNGNVIGVTLHEIGHAVHFQEDPDHWDNSHRFLCESFASYVGWYLGEQYYKSIGWVKPNGNSTITGNDQQTWTRTTNSSPTIGFGSNNRGWYSPLFIDLTDDHNQKTSPTSPRPNDQIKNVPPHIVWAIIVTCSNWEQCRGFLEAVGYDAHPSFCTPVEFDNWIADFDYWFENYN